jgi:hypothetical protein
MTMEAVKGEEYITFEQKNADEEAAHAATLPFARNIFDPMDFTPMVLDHINRIERRTTSAFELALSVVFVSGIQHYAEIPSGMARAPDYVQDYLRGVPSIWEDTRFLDGFPGRFLVVARRAGDRWYVAGINADAEPRELHLNLESLFPKVSGEAIVDGGRGNLSFRHVRVTPAKAADFAVTLNARDGFVMVLSPAR